MRARLHGCQLAQRGRSRSVARFPAMRPESLLCAAWSSARARWACRRPVPLCESVSPRVAFRNSRSCERSCADLRRSLRALAFRRDSVQLAASRLSAPWRGPKAIEEISFVGESSPLTIPAFDTSARGYRAQVDRIGLPAIFKPSTRISCLSGPFESHVESHIAPLSNLVSCGSFHWETYP